MHGSNANTVVYYLNLTAKNLMLSFIFAYIMIYIVIAIHSKVEIGKQKFQWECHTTMVIVEPYSVKHFLLFCSHKSTIFFTVIYKTFQENA